MKKEITAQSIWNEYQKGTSHKASLWGRGMYEQIKINERFFVGDQWHGLKIGRDKPLVRHNVISRIGKYKMAVLGASPVTVNYSAEGVPNTVGVGTDASEEIRNRMNSPEGMPDFSGQATAAEINFITGAMSDYAKVTAERLNFDQIKDKALTRAYISGSAVAYTWWDSEVETGLYADSEGAAPIRGDIRTDILDIENVYFGDPAEQDLQRQPYILLVQRMDVQRVRDIAERNGCGAEVVEAIRGDSDYSYQSGEYGQNESDIVGRTTVITRLWKERDKGGKVHVKAIQAVKGAIVRPAWDVGIRVYPLALFTWEQRSNCIYGESEITWLIPNQIAINRTATAGVWAVMSAGMPIMVVDSTAFNDQHITNEPGQVLHFNGDGSRSITSSIGYVNPPAFLSQFTGMKDALITDTLVQSGANDAALGDMRPENTSAIIAVREAATMPMQMIQTRFYRFIEDIHRVWAEFWVTMYGRRSLKIEDERGVWYMPFDGERYKNLLLSVKVDVGASTLWSEVQAIRTLDNLLERQIIDVQQYLERMPSGIIPDKSGLIKTLKQAQAAQNPPAVQGGAAAQTGGDIREQLLSQLSPEARATFESAPPEVQEAMINKALGMEGGAAV
jgi:hypothetical protein